MKNFIATLTLAIATIMVSVAQEKPAPRTEYTVELSSSTLEIKPGETKDVTISLNRSKAYSKSKATLGISSSLPEGVTVTFEPAEGVVESSIAKISVAANTKAGDYRIILTSAMQNKNKGATLKLVVAEGTNDTVTRN
jgi:uncharacterized membrane protein